MVCFIKKNLFLLLVAYNYLDCQTSGKFFPTGNVTGEFVRIYLGIKKGLSPHEASSTVFADLILATFSLFIIGLFSFF